VFIRGLNSFRRCEAASPYRVEKWEGANLSLFLTFLKFFPLREWGMWITSPASQDKAVRLRCPSGYWVFPVGMIGRAASFLPGPANGELIRSTSPETVIFPAKWGLGQGRKPARSES
jgi:hypothetical protein